MTAGRQIMLALFLTLGAILWLNHQLSKRIATDEKTYKNGTADMKNIFKWVVMDDGYKYEVVDLTDEFILYKKRRRVKP